MRKLEEKIALVTGGNGGIGLATAKQFVNEGAFVRVDLDPFLIAAAANSLLRVQSQYLSWFHTRSRGAS